MKQVIITTMRNLIVFGIAIVSRFSFFSSSIIERSLNDSTPPTNFPFSFFRIAVLMLTGISFPSDLRIVTCLSIVCLPVFKEHFKAQAFSQIFALGEVV